MDLKQEVVKSLKGAYGSIQTSRIKPTGVVLTRLLILMMLLPILLVITEYIMSFIRGYVNDDSYRIITTGITIIDHIFIPSVLTAIVGFLGLWIDKNNNGIPDRLEEEDKK
jgi:hypothetical protein|nr:MAG TPA: Neurotransmitter-gated ion-channel transmembrane region [Caudoviricetes sp.]